MIAFRHADPRFPFLREDPSQHAGRWNGAVELTHNFCDTPDGVWAEFLRHEEIDDPRDLSTIRRALWAVDIGDAPSLQPDLSLKTLTGGRESWPACQRWARERRGVAASIATPRPLCARAARTVGVSTAGSAPAPSATAGSSRCSGPRSDLVGWAATVGGCPGEELLASVRQF